MFRCIYNHKKCAFVVCFSIFFLTDVKILTNPV